MCLAIVRNPARSIMARIMLSIGVVALCWALGAATLWVTQSLFANDQISWRDFSSAQGRYSIIMPGAPDDQTLTIDTTAGPIDKHLALFENRSGAFVVIYADYPASLARQADPQQLLDDERDNAIAATKGALFNERRLALDGHPGREIKIDIPGDGALPAGVMTVRYYLVGDRLYEITVVTPKTRPAPDITQKFLDSFQLTP